MTYILVTFLALTEMTQIYFNLQNSFQNLHEIKCKLLMKTITPVSSQSYLY